MFKKPSDVEVSRSSALGGKDVKKFRQRVLQLLPNLDEAGFDDLFPGKSVTKTKLSIGAVIYVNVDGNPMILDPSNDHLDNAVPTIYALAQFPAVLPSIEVNASAVSSTMMRGSDLFLQGVSRDALEGPELLSGQLRSVRVPGNPIPFAVGTLAVSLKEADAAGWSGRGLITKHVYGDELWKIGDREIPNPGFEASCVCACSTANVAGELADDLADELAGKASLERDEKLPSHDDIVMNICIGALNSVKSSELPLSVDSFVTGKMTPLKPRGMSSLDLKKTSWKRAAKLLDVCSDLGMCKVKNVRKEPSLVEINREHEALRSYTPIELASNTGEDETDLHAKIRVFYKSPTVFLPLLGLNHKSDLISEADVESKLKAYCDGSCEGFCDAFLLENLYGKKERENVDPKTVPMDELRQRFISKLTKQTIFERVDPGTGKLIQVQVKGEMAPLKMAVLRRQGRLMTVVTSFEQYGFDGKELSDLLAKRMKTNAFTAAASESKSGASEVCLLGDWIAKRSGDHYLPSFFLERGLSKSMLLIDTGRKK